nr:hypothetical protein [Tanacetum cinerariifolium]
MCCLELFFLDKMDPYGSGTRTRCGFVLGSDGGCDGESCKWREMEKVGFTEVGGKMCTGTKWPFRVLLDIAPLVLFLNSFANMAETPPVVEL